MKTPVLFCQERSIYNAFPQADVWSLRRNALSFTGLSPVVAHPPCRLWGKLSRFSTAPPDEKALAVYAMNVVRLNGGVLEHPRGSRLFEFMDCGTFSQPDPYGGFMVGLDQNWYGHPCRKPTVLYVCGISKFLFPHPSPSYTLPTHVVGGPNPSLHLPRCSKYVRSFTPSLLAAYLLHLASLAR